MSGFRNELSVTQIGDNWRLWRLERDLVYELDNGTMFDVPAGFISDGASIPRCLWAFLPTWGRYARAAALHDFFYDCLRKGRPYPDAPTREHADFRFLIAMGDLGVERWVALMMWLAVLAVGLTLVDRIAAGTLMAGLFIVLFLFHSLPQMEHFKSYGVEAKWRARLHEADELLTKLRRSALASARLTYHTLGWGSRMADAGQSQKQALADEVDELLVELGTAKLEIDAIKSEYLRFAVLDLFRLLESIVDLNVKTNTRRVQTRLNQLGGPGTKTEADELRPKLHALQITGRNRPDAFSDLVKKGKIEDFRGYCKKRIPANLLPERDVLVLKEFADQVASNAETCLESGRVTDEACDLIGFTRTKTAKRSTESYLARTQDSRSGRRSRFGVADALTLRHSRPPSLNARSAFSLAFH